MNLLDRARLYLAKCPVSVSGSGGHNAAFTVACALVKGFDLSPSDARSLLAEWNRGCQPPWSERELEHKLQQADKVPDTERRGYLISDGYATAGTSGAVPPRATDTEGRLSAGSSPAPSTKPAFDEVALRRFSKGWEDHVNLLWLANRSAQDPATVSASMFLRLLYAPGEFVVVFTDERSQGQAVWPEHELPALEQRRGAWFLAQPVDGESHPNPRTGKLSRRSEESVRAFRYLVIESDDAPVKFWLGALAQLPLQIAAIYTSGGRSVHALVRVDCPTKPAWDEVKRQMAAGLVMLGADPGAMSAVRLTRLPGYYRAEKQRWQKLLYIAPAPLQRPLIEMPVLRDVEAVWCGYAAAGIADTDDDGGRWIESGLAYYAPVSPRCKAALEEFKKGVLV